MEITETNTAYNIQQDHCFNITKNLIDKIRSIIIVDADVELIAGELNGINFDITIKNSAKFYYDNRDLNFEELKKLNVIQLLDILYFLKEYSMKSVLLSYFIIDIEIAVKQIHDLIYENIKILGLVNNKYIKISDNWIELYRFCCSFKKIIEM